MRYIENEFPNINQFLFYRSLYRMKNGMRFSKMTVNKSQGRLGKLWYIQMLYLMFYENIFHVLIFI